ncbi:cold-shock protein [Pedobacter paludis]|uniref:Cold-shock protein n=1 Tax=Pedobacter paludis TaxID=2203212 RepID=A0A317F3Z7_9SPHI|nr:cold shock domain-containing protein [Pedobacter paludis]PWS33864.1 cold-shock protein [Pedobacter paludis]
MQTGTVKFFNETKGFGFIKSSTGEEVFVHASGLIHNIKEGDEVTFELQDGKKGVNAVDVRIALV